MMALKSRQAEAFTEQLHQRPDLLREEAWLDGRWAEAEGGGRIQVTNPADGSLIGTVPDMGVAETARAVAAADVAWAGWRKTSPKTAPGYCVAGPTW